MGNAETSKLKLHQRPRDAKVCWNVSVLGDCVEKVRDAGYKYYYIEANPKAGVVEQTVIWLIARCTYRSAVRLGRQFGKVVDLSIRY